MGEEAFVMSYFRTKREALHLAVSRNGYNWRPLNRNRPILTSPLGTKTMRDPSLFRDREGYFHLLTTDGWRSTSIIHARSDDLIHWRDMRALPVMAGVPGARNSWAPEAFYDEEKRVYRIIWSSTVSPKGPRDLRDHRIWSATTEDFREYGHPHPFFDPGYSVIDATIRRRGDNYVMAFKDERGKNHPDAPFKAIRTVISRGDCRSFGEISDIVTPPLSEGPILFLLYDRWILLYDRYSEGRWGASISVDLRNWVTISRITTFPKGARHGSVLAVEPEVLNRLEDRL
jgi:hypothetical protein